MEAVFARGARERRALNIIWSAAGRYDFLPDFLAFHGDGSPDLYLNAIVGLAYRCYDAGALAAFRRELDDSWLGRTFTGLYWLALENVVYEHCRRERPALPILRRQHAERYLADNEDLAMQQLMMRDDLVHSLKAARCRDTLGASPGLLNPWERRLYDALAFDGTMTTEEIIGELRDVLRRFFLFRYGLGRSRRGLHFFVGAGLAALLRRLLPTPPEEAVTPRLGNAPSGDGSAPGVMKRLLGSGSPDDPVKALTLFPRPLMAEENRRNYEQAFCTGLHRKAHLYYAASRRDDGQRAANLAVFRAQGARCRVAIRRLAGRIRNTLAICREPIPLRAGRGSFCPRFVWQALYRQDGRVFTTSRPVRYAGFSVTLLLDASESRSRQQGDIAVQAYIIAAALAQAGIPLQIAAFCSLAGTTVIHRMKGFDTAENSAAFEYAAAGWNRDGLALRAVRPLLAEGPGTPLLLVLTDARPSDDRPIPGGGLSVPHDYTGERAVADTAGEVRDLRRRGVRVVGLLQSEVAGAAETARRIFGESFARIERVDQLAAAVARLIEGQIRQSALG